MKINIGRYQKIIDQINRQKIEYEALNDSELAGRADLLKSLLKSGETLDNILPRAFALVREAAKRRSGLWAFDVQLMGAIAVHQGNIVEMKTGEGKTLTILFPAFLNALFGKGVHVVTANDYLAERDAEWAGGIMDLLGISVGAVTSRSSDFDRQVAYVADITYVTNNEVCFDYLKDNMLYDPMNTRQRGLYFAIIDEADSVLIDEAQTPLVISENDSASEKEKHLFNYINKIVETMVPGDDFEIDEKTQTIDLTSAGIVKLEKTIGVKNLYDEDNQDDYLYYVERLLKAHHLFQKEKDYVIEGGQVVIVDEFTGRLMPNHRYFQGIHQAIEAKEHLLVQDETKTLASTTFQNFFNRYEKIAGLTGTAQTAEKEFRLIYKKEVLVIPTNAPVIRQDQPDLFFPRWQDKMAYLSWTTQEYYFKKRPVLIGTRSVGRSQQVHQALVAKNIPGNVLNAKNSPREAEVIAQAGQLQIVTVATNMAGRGTDIALAEGVRELGGLVVFGTERHNSRRIDNQLIGRAGRQGDPGMTQFLISGDDDLIGVHFREQYEKEISKAKITDKGVNTKNLEKVLLKAQKRYENVFFDQRILAYEFDKVLDLQREAFYRQRKRVLMDRDLKRETLILIKHEIYQLLLSRQNQQQKMITESQVAEVGAILKEWIGNEWFKLESAAQKHLPFYKALDLLYGAVAGYYQDFEQYISAERMRNVEKVTTLKVLDLLWADHLDKVEQLQDAALISSISMGDFFEQYEMQMGRAFQNMMYGVPKIICKTLFRTINRIWQMEAQSRIK
jgi:preprotein translocase subunit SecA